MSVNMSPTSYCTDALLIIINLKYSEKLKPVTEAGTDTFVQTLFKVAVVLM